MLLEFSSFLDHNSGDSWGDQDNFDYDDTIFNIGTHYYSELLLKYMNFKGFQPLARSRRKSFTNCNLPYKNVSIVSKKVGVNNKIRRLFKAILRVFSKMGYNKSTKQKSPKYLAYLFMYFLITHDLYSFLNKIVTFLQNTERQFQFRLVRIFKLFNQSYFRSVLRFFRVSGMYFKISGKFGGVGGSKKLRKHIVISRPKFSDRTLKLQRSVQYVWSFTGTTTWSVYALYLNV